jgi:cytochrome c oxidase assembly factor CtaG
MSDAVHDIFADWTLPIGLTVSIVITAALYVRGWLAIRKTRPEQFTDVRLASFLGGLALLWLVTGSPMDGFADALLSAHMVEHLLMMSAIPMLLLYGLPVVPLLRGLPAPLLRWIVGPLLRVSALRRVGQWLVTPAIAWLAMNVAYLCWHIPAAYDLALENETVHGVEHLCFLVTSLLFWWYILRPWPAEERPDDWGMLVYLALGDVVMTLLSAFLAFCERPVYPYYINHPNPFHIPVLEDQVLGAVIMWVLGSFAYLVPAMVITLRLTGFDEGSSVPANTRRRTNR